MLTGSRHLEWRLPGPVDPRAMVQAEWRVGGVRLPTPLWSSDSVVTVMARPNRGVSGTAHGRGTADAVGAGAGMPKGANPYS